MLNLGRALVAGAAAVLMSLALSTAGPAAAQDGDRWDHGGSHQGPSWNDDRGHETNRDGDRRDRAEHRSHHDQDRGPTHVCKRGGYEDLVRAETGVGFDTQGECLRHDALGGAYSSLTIDLETSYGCGSDDGESCWGLVDGVNLQPNSSVFVQWTSTEGDQSQNFARFAANQGGGLSAQLNFRCDESDNVITDLTATGTTSAGAGVTSDPVTVPCNANVVD